MLNGDQEYLLALLRESMGVIRSGGGSERPESPQAVTKAICRNGIILTVFRQLPPDLQDGLRSLYYKTMKQVVTQEHEGERVLEALSGAGFDCIGLKGWELRKKYPDQMMRQMADLDILVRPYEYAGIKKTMQGLGYSAKDESSWKHDNFSLNEVNIEMHKRLTDDSGVIRKWERSVWDRAKRLSGRVYAMSDEDFYIFHFIHLHKDFLNGSLGLRRIVDTWLLQKQDLDREYIDGFFGKIGITDFHEKMVCLSRVCMGEAETDPDSEILLAHAFKYGIYGSRKAYKAGRIVSMSSGSVASGKIRSLFAAVFLPFGRMKAQFPILEKWPILLPFCWIKRVFGLLKGDRKAKKARLDYRDIKQEDFDEFKKIFKAGGVTK